MARWVVASGLSAGIFQTLPEKAKGRMAVSQQAEVGWWPALLEEGLGSQGLGNGSNCSAAELGNGTTQEEQTEQDLN